MPTTELTGLHHVTAIAGRPADNLAFYRGALGLRLVKRTVNFDDPFTWHLYYGDDAGSPGTLLTHFPNPLNARAGHGGSEITDTLLAVAPGSLRAWAARLAADGAQPREGEMLGGPALLVDDPDGMRLALVESARAPHAVPERRVGRVESVVVRVPDAAETRAFVEGVLGFRPGETHGDVAELRIGPEDAPQRLLIVHDPAAPRAPMGAGTVHHVAWRVPDDAAQARVAAAVRAAGVGVTPVMDRQYFRSVYFRVPGSVIFEVATDGPGFAVDEAPERLGSALRLPAQYEPRRDDIQRRLPPLPEADP